jgi:hypothetical protein
MKPKRRYDSKSRKVYYTIKYSKVLHREDGPAVIYYGGIQKRWHRYGKLHRVDGPAIIVGSFLEEWYTDGKRHRLDGPAVEWFNGSRGVGRAEWWVNGLCHREDGPAVTCNGNFEWYLNGWELTKEQWFEALSPERQQVMLFSEYFVN